MVLVYRLPRCLLCRHQLPKTRAAALVCLKCPGPVLKGKNRADYEQNEILEGLNSRS